MQTAHHDDVDVLAQIDAIFNRPEQIDQLTVDDSDKLLRRFERQQNFLAECLVRDSAHELFDNVVADVGFEQRFFDHFQAVTHVTLSQLAFSTKRLEGTFEIVL